MFRRPDVRIESNQESYRIPLFLPRLPWRWLALAAVCFAVALVWLYLRVFS